MRRFFLWAAFGMATCLAAPAAANTLTAAANACVTSALTFEGQSADHCAGAYLGNDSQLGFESMINSVFGLTNGYTWLEEDKAESGSNSGVLISSGFGSNGTFAAMNLTAPTVFVIKAATCFSAFLFNNAAAANGSGTFDTGAAGLRSGQGNNCDGRNTPGLSHLTMYTVVDGVPPTGGPLPIPLPAGLVLLLGGLGGMAALRRTARHSG